jgi:anthranilate phosphoribosyltransferase
VTARLDEMGGWPAVLGPLTAGLDITSVQAGAVMAEILDGKASPAQIAAFIVALRMKGETVEEMTGLLATMVEFAESVPLSDALRERIVDTCGTGGDRSHTINVSTVAAFVVAGAGIPVCKHGNRAASSACGSADVLEALGVAIALSPAGVAACIEEAGIGFCFAPSFHPAMRHAGPTRKELGVPTVFNFLGPIANPGRARRQVLGVSDPKMADKVLGVLQANGARRALVVHGDDGLDELTTTTTSRVVQYDAEVGVRAYVVDPQHLGLKPAALDDLRGGDAQTNADLARRVLDGDGGAHRDLVALNAGAGIVAGGGADDIAEGLALALQSIATGAARQALDNLIEVSQREA